MAGGRLLRDPEPLMIFGVDLRLGKSSSSFASNQGTFEGGWIGVDNSRQPAPATIAQ